MDGQPERHNDFVQLIVDCLKSLFYMQSRESYKTVIKSIEDLLNEHYNEPATSQIRTLIPGIGRFFTPLPFVDAFTIYNNKYNMTSRQFVPPSTDEVRHILNIAHVLAIQGNLKLMTFDGDQTLYPDGENFTDPETASHLITLLQKGTAVSIVTAAGYGYQFEKYEERLHGLLEAFKERELPAECRRKFFVFGGECNYMMRCGDDFHLEPVPPEDWQKYSTIPHQKTPEVDRMLDIAEACLEENIDRLNLRALVIRKERAVGLIPGGREGLMRKRIGSGKTQLKNEILEELALAVKRKLAIAGVTLPFCAFNGGRDVWVDVGNKAVGIAILQKYLDAPAETCIHCGDQFGDTGNDLAARNVCPTLWITNPRETNAVLRSLLLKQVRPMLVTRQLSRYSATGSRRLLEPPREDLSQLSGSEGDADEESPSAFLIGA